jgi:hypothetical protein
MLPMWVLQIVPVIAMVTAGTGAYVTQRSDVAALKESLVEVKTMQQQNQQNQQSIYVSKQIFDLKLAEQERIQANLNQRLDRIEDLITGLYDRIPAKVSKPRK